MYRAPMPAHILASLLISRRRWTEEPYCVGCYDFHWSNESCQCPECGVYNCKACGLRSAPITIYTPAEQVIVATVLEPLAALLARGERID